MTSRTLIIAAVALAAGVTTSSTAAVGPLPPKQALVFASDRAARLIRPAIFTIGVDGRGRHRITRNFFYVDSLRWSPGGRWVAFIGDGQLHLVRARGGKSRLLARRLRPSNLSWSPDGSQLAFLSGSDLFVTRLGARKVQRLAQSVSSGPSWSPDGWSIAFTRGGELWTIDLAMRREHRVLGHWWHATDPDWSPDGRWIAFAYSDWGNDFHRIYSLDLRTRKARLLGHRMHRPVWSPDGTRVLASTASVVYVVGPGGRHVRRVFRTRRGRERLLAPAWSRDSRQVAVATDEVYLVDADGGGRRRATRERPASTLVDADLSWSPDGRRLAYVAEAYDPGDNDLYTVSGGDRSLRALTRNWVDEWSPDWSPDGRSLAFTRYESRKPFVAVLRPGKRARKLAPGGNPAWSPDGRLIAFDRGGDLYVISPDGSGERLVLSGPDNDTDPDWSPDGRELVFERPPPTGYRPVELWAVNLAGSGLRRITDVRRGRHRCEVTSASDPAWSPDGSEIVFALLEASGDCILPARGGRSIYAVRADGSGEQRLLVRGPATDFQDEAYAPAWSPDGRYVAFVSDIEYRGGIRIGLLPSTGGRFRFVTGKSYKSYDPAWRPLR